MRKTEAQFILVCMETYAVQNEAIRTNPMFTRIKKNLSQLVELGNWT